MRVRCSARGQGPPLCPGPRISIPVNREPFSGALPSGQRCTLSTAPPDQGSTAMTAIGTRFWPYPRLVAHRGAGKLAPENTLTAMRVGHAHGYRMVEFDVKLAADNVSFLLHDATLERTTSGRGRADALLVARTVAARRRGLALREVRGRAPAHAGVDRPLGARARRGLQHRDQADARPRARDGRGRRAGCGHALARRRRAAAAVVVLRGRARRRARCGAGSAAGAAAGDDTGRLAGSPCAARMRGAGRGPRGAHARNREGGARPRASRALLHPNEAARIGELAGWNVDGIITDAVDHIVADSLPPAPPL